MRFVQTTMPIRSRAFAMGSADNLSNRFPILVQNYYAADRLVEHLPGPACASPLFCEKLSGVGGSSLYGWIANFCKLQPRLDKMRSVSGEMFTDGWP